MLTFDRAQLRIQFTHQRFIERCVDAGFRRESQTCGGGHPGADIPDLGSLPDPALAGKTLEEIAAIWNVTPVAAYMRIVKATSAEVGISQSMEAIIGTSMSEDDVRWFIAQPQIMFCSDGNLHGAAET